MKYDRHLVSLPWDDYELLDSGENMKLERFGGITVARPETQALWAKLRPQIWKEAHAEFAFRDKKGAWDIKKQMPEQWELSWGGVRFGARLTGFKHTGVFPEQSPNWVWIKDQVKKLGIPNVRPSAERGSAEPSKANVRPSAERGSTEPSKANVLNLFGYTGIASLVAAHAGAFVTHVDASKQSLDWANLNAKLSHLGEGSIRWIPDDALAFAKREARRGAAYDGIILDPPAFGRGGKGEVWKIEEDFHALLQSLKELLSEKPGSFFLVNGYAAGYAPRSFAQAVESVFGNVNGEAGELHIQESSSERVIPSGIYVRFAR